MKQLPLIDTYYKRVNKIKSLLNIDNLNGSKERIGNHIATKLKGSFDIFFLDEINQVKLGKNDLLDHNKLRFYKQLKGTFKIEPYIENITNR